MKQKGAAIRSTLAALESLHGAGALAQVKEAIGSELRAQLEPTILAVAWYPIEVSAAIHAAIRDVVGKGTWDASHAIGVAASRSDFTGIYRVFLRAIQYDDIWNRSERAWANYNSQGEARWVEREHGAARGLIEGVNGFNPGVWNAVAGRCEELLRMAGAKGASIEVTESTSQTCKLSAIWLE